MRLKPFKRGTDRGSASQPPKTRYSYYARVAGEMNAIVTSADQVSELRASRGRQQPGFAARVCAANLSVAFIDAKKKNGYFSKLR